MESIIEELYYGNITPSERSFCRTEEYAHILQLVTRNEEKLTETLTEAQKETFEKFHDCWSEYMSLGEAAIFEYAFKLGMQIAIETLTE